MGLEQGEVLTCPVTAAQNPVPRCPQDPLHMKFASIQTHRWDLEADSFLPQLVVQIIERQSPRQGQVILPLEDNSSPPLR